MTPRERFRLALEGRAVAFVPLAWERLPELVRQTGENWWRDPATGSRLLADAAALAGADAMIVAAAADGLTALRASGVRGDDALDAFAESPEAGSGYELVRWLSGSAPFAVVAALPDVAALQSQLEASEPEVAEDALTDLARGYLDAGTDALAILGSAQEEVRAAAARAATVGDFYDRRVLAVCNAPSGVTAWVQGRDAVEVGVLSDEGQWPAIDAGVVITAGDATLRWDAARLHAVGSARP